MRALHSFQRGAGLFSCRMCNRRTRGDGDAAGVLLCAQCYECSGIENALSDGHAITSADVATVEANIATLVERGASDGALKAWRELLAALRNAVANGGRP